MCIRDSAATDEDDSDPEEISVTQTFDLALTKTQVGGAVIPGADKEFTITIYNQGTLDAYNIEISDYVPTGLTFNASRVTNILNNWALAGGIPTTTIVGPLAPGANETVSIVLTVDSNFQGTSLVNSAEISSADNDTDGTNTFPTDVDSTPDTNASNDAGGSEGTGSDDAINGDGTGTCLLYTSPSPRDATLSRMPSSA